MEQQESDPKSELSGVDMEPIELRAISPGKSFTPVSIQVLDVDGGGLRMRFTGGEWQHFSEPNLFKCLMSLRTYLEKQELLLCCQGARPDVFPSGMQQQMEGGRFTTILSRLSDGKEVVDIFAAAEPSQVASVEGQRIAVYRFFNLPTSGAGTE